MIVTRVGACGSNEFYVRSQQCEKQHHLSHYGNQMWAHRKFVHIDDRIIDNFWIYISLQSKWRPLRFDHPYISFHLVCVNFQKAASTSRINRCLCVSFSFFSSVADNYLIQHRKFGRYFYSIIVRFCFDSMIIYCIAFTRAYSDHFILKMGFCF